MILLMAAQAEALQAPACAVADASNQSVCKTLTVFTQQFRVYFSIIYLAKTCLFKTLSPW